MSESSKGASLGASPADGTALMSQHAAQTRIIVEAVEGAVSRSLDPIKADIREIKKDVRKLLIGLVTGFLILAGMVLTSYRWLSTDMLSASDRLSDRISALEKSTTRADQKLEDLIARLPPATTAIPQPPRK